MHINTETNKGANCDVDILFEIFIHLCFANYGTCFLGDSLFSTAPS